MTYPTISILTATYNCDKNLPTLIKALQNQTDKDFIWIVIDGNSTDQTTKLIKEVHDLEIDLLIEPDFGIYDALNKGVKRVKSAYYLTVGADDVLRPDAIERFKAAITESNHADFIAAAYEINQKIYYPMSGRGWLYGMPGEASSHSVALLIKQALHQRFGFYSKKLPIAADQLFFLKAFNAGAHVFRAQFVAGAFSSDGASGSDGFGVITELFRAQVMAGNSFWVQFLLLILRMLKLALFSHHK